MNGDAAPAGELWQEAVHVVVNEVDACLVTVLVGETTPPEVVILTTLLAWFVVGVVLLSVALS